MPQKSFITTKIVRLYLKARAKLADRESYFVCVLIIYQTAVYLHNAPRCRLVDAGGYLAVFGEKSRLYLVSVMIWLLHTDYIVNVAIFAEQGNKPCLLVAELLLVAQV